MTRFRFVALSLALGCGIALTGILGTAQTAITPAATAQQKAATVAKSDGIVGVYIESVARQITIADLQRKYPGTTAARVDLASMKADTIVGWYDKGHNFHEQKMEKNLGHDFGGLKVIQPVLRGVAIR